MHKVNRIQWIRTPLVMGWTWVAMGARNARKLWMTVQVMLMFAHQIYIIVYLRNLINMYRVMIHLNLTTFFPTPVFW